MPDALVVCDNYMGRQTITLQYGETFWYSLRRYDQTLCESKLGEDLLTLAGVVQIADRAFRRRFRLGELTRRFHIQMSVNLPERWRAVSGGLSEALSFLSSDNWFFSFTKRSEDGGSPVRDRSSRQRGPDISADLGKRSACISLFSGGLDSFCGAAYLLGAEQNVAGGDDCLPVFVTSYLKDLSRLQDELLSPLSWQTDASHLHIPIYFRADPKSTGGFVLADFPERTRRARSFFYIAQAAAFALSHRISELNIFENGVLALNLPLRADRTGARCTRHAHPFFLEKVQSFLRSLGGGEWSPTVINRFDSLTKAEILSYASQCPDLTSNTVSCWHYGNFTATLRRKLNQGDITHCGFCLPCLVRRLALRSADMPDPPVAYGYDVFQSAKNGFPIPQDRKDQWLDAQALVQFARDIESLDEWGFYDRYADSLLHIDPFDSSEDLSIAYGMMRRFAKDVITYLGQ